MSPRLLVPRLASDGVKPWGSCRWKSGNRSFVAGSLASLQLATRIYLLEYPLPGAVSSPGRMIFTCIGAAFSGVGPARSDRALLGACVGAQEPSSSSSSFPPLCPGCSQHREAGRSWQNPCRGQLALPTAWVRVPGGVWGGGTPLAAACGADPEAVTALLSLCSLLAAGGTKSFLSRTACSHPRSPPSREVELEPVSFPALAENAGSFFFFSHAGKHRGKRGKAAFKYKITEKNKFREFVCQLGKEYLFQPLRSWLLASPVLV